MKERPILFNAEMVRAVLDGRKTQTRRVVNPQPETAHGHDGLVQVVGYRIWAWPERVFDGTIRCPYGAPGDRLWVRETWAPYDGADKPRADIEAECVRYRADGVTYIGGPDDPVPLNMYGVPPHEEMPGGPWRWRPSIHMPRWASRITLEVTDVRVERVQDIRADDIYAEGTPGAWDFLHHQKRWIKAACLPACRTAWVELWDSINAKCGYGWDANPWVWVVSFKRVAS